MFVEISALQSFPPANLNRDQNGLPKTTMFGGKVRGRISSQCQKRAARMWYRIHSDIPVEHLAERSRTWLPQLAQELSHAGISQDDATLVAKLCLGILGAKIKDGEIVTDTILFLGTTEIRAIAALVAANWDAIEPDLRSKTPAISKEFCKVIANRLVMEPKPGEIALFGRMMAALPIANVDAAVQVAHAIGVATCDQEFDYFTAVDDLLPRGESGAAMIGETPFNSSVYYRYCNIDVQQLLENVGGSTHLVNVFLRAMVEAFIQSVPRGHQNGFAAHSRPAVVIATVRSNQPFSLVNAFENAVRPREGRSILEQSALQLGVHWQDITEMWGDRYISLIKVAAQPSLKQFLGSLTPYCDASVETLIDAVAAHVQEGLH